MKLNTGLKCINAKNPRQQPTNCLSVFDHFVQLVLKGLNSTCFVWPVWKFWCYRYENGWVCSWRKNLYVLIYIGTYTVSAVKTASKKIKTLIRSKNFFFMRLLISINLPCSLPWSTVIMPRLMHLPGTWIYWKSYKNGYVGLLVLHLLIAEIKPA